MLSRLTNQKDIGCGKHGVKWLKPTCHPIFSMTTFHSYATSGFGSKGSISQSTSSRLTMPKHRCARRLKSKRTLNWTSPGFIQTFGWCDEVLYWNELWRNLLHLLQLFLQPLSQYLLPPGVYFLLFFRLRSYENTNQSSKCTYSNTIYSFLIDLSIILIPLNSLQFRLDWFSEQN